MRLFIGLPLPPNARETVAAVLDRLRTEDWPVRWIRGDGLHVTLKFFGEVTSDRVGAIAEVLAFAARDVKPMVLTMRGLGAFPTISRPRVIHLDLEAGTDLELLQDRIERGGDGLGFAPDGRPFRPHVTLGRVREGHRLPSGWQQALEDVQPEESFIADRVVLYESELTPTGPVYAAREEIRLA